MKEAFHQTIFLADGKRKDGGGGHSSWSGGTRGLGCGLAVARRAWSGEEKQNGHSRVCCGSGLIDGCLFLFARGSERMQAGVVTGEGRVLRLPVPANLSGLVEGMCGDGRLGCCRL